MDQAWDRAHGPRPSIASVRVRALSWQGRHKPRPQSKAPGSRGGSHSGRLPEEHLSPARLVSAGGLGSGAGARMADRCPRPAGAPAPAPPLGRPQVFGDTDVPQAFRPQKGPSQAQPQIC